MNLISVLLDLVKPLLSRILVALGISIVSYTGMTAVLSGLNTAIQNNFSAMPSVAMNLVGLSGFGEALGILVGAFAFRLSMNTFKRFEFK
ncbi:DUF2523 domain-containing protein [Vogesella sp. LYT5W]|uniref:DUF2523 domain-containing protein n=1 Tax=Vogesella margarita TaxID=2984199 RepID=A0ABT5IU56_9NEIS|nr:DUF2523 domain-containing protein [Vogesella margarita]MDC7715144.1 DUF2523 domain-containing protein [Vogesella margarita]